MAILRVARPRAAAFGSSLRTTRHRIAITKVEAGLIAGPNESVPVDQVRSLEIEKAKSAPSFPFGVKDAVPWAITIAAFALKPISVEATP
jgi:hypothetical protein